MPSEITAEDLKNLRADIRTLADGMATQRQEDRAERRRNKRARIALVLTVVSLVFDLTLTVFLKRNIDTTNKTQQSQHTACIETNKGRDTLRVFFDGIWQQNVAELKLNPTHLPTDVVQRQLVLVQEYEAKTNQSFSDSDCSKLPH